MEIVIKPKKSWKINFKELWSYRELFWSFAVRDIKVMYKQTIMGIAWAILQPFLMMVVFSIFFGKIAGIGTEGSPYPIFVFVGLLFWNYFSGSLSGISGSMVSNQSMIQKIYFPRVILPLSSVIVNLVNFAFASLILIGLMFYYHFSPSFVGILMIIPAIIVTSFSFVGLGLFFASVNVKYRDVRYVLPFFIQLILFVTPVIYPPVVLGHYQWLWYLNPMSGVIQTMRVGLLGIGQIDWLLFMGSLVLSLIIFVFGILYFNKTEKEFADLV